MFSLLRMTDNFEFNSKVFLMEINFLYSHKMYLTERVALQASQFGWDVAL